MLPAALQNTVLKIYHRINRSLHGSGSQVAVARVSEAEKDLTETPFHPPDVLEGDPVMRGVTLNESKDGGMATGIWDCTAGRFRWFFLCDEVVHILEGEVEVKVGDKTERLVPGSVAYFPIGTDSEWYVKNYVKKVYFHRHPMPMTKKLVGA